MPEQVGPGRHHPSHHAIENIWATVLSQHRTVKPCILGGMDIRCLKYHPVAQMMFTPMMRMRMEGVVVGILFLSYELLSQDC
jgi:hypothetical protein